MIFVLKCRYRRNKRKNHSQSIKIDKIMTFSLVYIKICHMNPVVLDLVWIKSEVIGGKPDNWTSIKYFQLFLSLV